jgi:hypothetical protein
LLSDIADFPRQQRDIMRAMAEDIRQVEQRFCENLIAPYIAAIGQEIHSPAIDAYLEQVKRHTVEHLDAFKEPVAQDGLPPGVPPAVGQDPVGQQQLYEYEVNVVVDNAHTTGAPVLTENTPTYQNLFGSIERVLDRGGRLVTNFTRIKAGSVLRAHGGYLIFNLEDALTEPAVWKTLKRTLKSGRIAPETYEPFSLLPRLAYSPNRSPSSSRSSSSAVRVCITVCTRSTPSFKICLRSTPTFDTPWSSAVSTVSCTANGSPGYANRSNCRILIGLESSAWSSSGRAKSATVRRSRRRTPRSPTWSVRPPTGRVKMRSGW